jgi:hypothetical protein
LTQPLNGRLQGGHIRGVARPEFAANRSALDVHGQAHDHLAQLGPVVFVVATFAQALAAFAFEVKGGRVEKDQLDFGEQVAPTLEERLLELILEATPQGGFRWWPRRLGLRLAQKRHRPVEVL